MKLHPLIIGCALFLLASLPVFAELEMDVWFVVRGGLWQKSNSEYGNFRVIVKNEGWEHTRSFLYLQWLKADDQKKEVRVLKETAVSEFNDGGWFHVMNVERKDNMFLISYVARGEEEVKKVAELRPALPGTYRFVVKK